MSNFKYLQYSNTIILVVKYFSVTEEFERPESRLAFVNNKNSDLKCDLEKLSLLNEADASKSSLYSQDDEMEGACGGIEVVEDEKVHYNFIIKLD